jgi:integrase
VNGRSLDSKRSERTLALPLPLVAALYVHKAAQMGERMLAGSDWQNDDDLVFAQANGRPIDKKSDYDDWCRLLERAGVRHVRLHDGRHTAATLLLSEGVHPRVVMELLGHSQMRTTMDIYSHVMPALAREAADRMGAVLLSPLATNGNQTGNQDFLELGPSASSPLEMGGAEGTRTPDPHTASPTCGFFCSPANSGIVGESPYVVGRFSRLLAVTALARDCCSWTSCGLSAD